MYGDFFPGPGDFALGDLSLLPVDRCRFHIAVDHEVETLEVAKAILKQFSLNGHLSVFQLRCNLDSAFFPFLEVKGFSVVEYVNQL